MNNLGIFDKDTGEVVDCENYIIKSQEEVDRIKGWIKKKNEYDIKGLEINERYKSYGTFIWFLYNANHVLDLGIKCEDLTKLIFISTYMSYDNNRLMTNKNTCMTKESIQKLLKVSDVTFWRFYKSVSDAKILIEDENGISLNSDIFSRGASKNIKNIDKNRMRIYTDSVRHLYNKAGIREHGLLSYLFQAIPFVNINYNMLCSNPLEVDINKVKPMLFEEYCEIIGYDVDNVCRLKRKIRALRIEKLPVFNFVDNADGLFCYINPNVYYAGNNFKEVRVLGEFVKE